MGGNVKQCKVVWTKMQAKGGVDLAEYCLELMRVSMAMVATLVIPPVILMLAVALIMKLL